MLQVETRVSDQLIEVVGPTSLEIKGGLLDAKLLLAILEASFVGTRVRVGDQPIEVVASILLEGEGDLPDAKLLLIMSEAPSSDAKAQAKASRYLVEPRSSMLSSNVAFLNKVGTLS